MKKTKENNIKNIVKKGLCTSCGMCYAICPQNAINISVCKSFKTPKPKINENCTNCGLCLKVCPGGEVNFDELNESLFGKISDNYYLGNIENSYIAHAQNEEVRYNGASGGIITSILLYLIKNKIVDAIINAKMETDPVLSAKAQIITDEDGIKNSVGSVYCVCDVNSAIKEVLKTPNKKYAFIGLPCHIQALRKAQNINPILKERIILVIGLFCGRAQTLKGSEHLLTNIIEKDEKIKKFRYRGFGYPGELHILTDQNNYHVNKKSWYDNFFSGSFFENPRCMLCNDLLAELADISCGDVGLAEFSDDKKGISLILTRTQTGENLWENLVNENIVYSEKRNVEELIFSQAAMLWYKKESLFTRMFLRKLLNLKNVNYRNSANIFKHKITLGSTFVSLCNYLNIIISNNKFTESLLLRNLPKIFLAKYCKILSIVKWLESKKLRKNNWYIVKND